METTRQSYATSSAVFEINSEETASPHELSPAELLTNEVATFAAYHKDFKRVQKGFILGDFEYQTADELRKVSESNESRLNSLSLLLLVYGGTSQHPQHAFYRECVLDELRMTSRTTNSDILQTQNALLYTANYATAAKAASMKEELIAVNELLNRLQNALP